MYTAGVTTAGAVKEYNPVFIQTEVESIKQCFMIFTNQVVQTYGIRESPYIITPKFQELIKMVY